MTLLDCTSPESTIASLAALLNRSESTLRRQLEAGQLDEYYGPGKFPGRDNRDIVVEDFLGISGGVRSADEIYWFHATRVLPETTFCEGILPLAQIEPRLQATLDRLSTGLQRTRGDGNSALHYHNKLTNPTIGGGPCAFLIREAAVRPAGTHCAFAECPEIVGDIARMRFDEASATELLRRFRAATKPCVVTFRTREPRPDATASAALYAYLCIHNPPSAVAVGAGFSAKGHAVPPEDVVGYEFL
jgi:hypothetical protein